MRSRWPACPTTPVLSEAAWIAPPRPSGEVAVARVPDDSVMDILSHLQVKPLFRFKCVSKGWCGLIDDRIRKLPRTLQGFFAGKGGESYGAFIDLSERPLVDPASFSFLTKLPEINKIVLLDSCNGLVLFGHWRGFRYIRHAGYIVCNPAIEEWVSVPNPIYTNNPGERDDGDDEEYRLDCPYTHTYLIFDPAISPHFQLIQFRFGCRFELDEVHTFSSVTGSWRLVEGVPHHIMLDTIGVCLSNDMLHFGAEHQPWHPPENKHMILAVGGEERPCRTLHWPDNDRGFLVFVGQSQGHLHCLSGFSTNFPHETMAELSIWVLEDYNAEKWVLKDNVSFSQLFGTKSGRLHSDWNVVGIHPDRGLVFFTEYWNHKLVAYDMDKKEVSALCSLHGYHKPIIPYVPYFAQSAALAKKR